jgi:hypothetical protein
MHALDIIFVLNCHADSTLLLQSMEWIFHHEKGKGSPSSHLASLAGTLQGPLSLFDCEESPPLIIELGARSV